jgi:hypothetical protein
MHLKFMNKITLKKLIALIGESYKCDRCFKMHIVAL